MRSFVVPPSSVVAAILPEPVGPRLAPVPTSIDAAVFVADVMAENAVPTVPLALMT